MIKLEAYDPAFLMKKGKRYSVKGVIPIMPIHSDDYGKVAKQNLMPMRRVADPSFEVLEVRPKQGTNFPWYRVRLADEHVGWINCIALVQKEIQNE